MIIVKLALLILATFILPILFGGVISKIAGVQQECKTSYLFGMVFMLCMFYIWVKPGIEANISLSETSQFILSRFLGLAILAIAVFLFFLYRNRRKQQLYTMFAEMVIIIVISFLLAGISLCVKSNKADYTVEIVNTMYLQDTLFRVEPLTGKELADLSRDEQNYFQEFVEAPIPALYAVAVYELKMVPSKFVHIILPFLIFPFYVCVYMLWGQYLFKTEKKKRILFNFFVWMLLAMGLLQKWDVVFDIFACPWNGETLFFLGLLPFSVLTFLKLEEDIEKNKYFLVLIALAFCFSAKLLYCYGLFIEIFIITMFLICMFLRRCSNGRSNTTA